jgi:ABC-type spermidine/putrescine transport system permease subunit I
MAKPRGWAMRHGPALLLAPGLGFLLFVFVGPIVLLLSRSLFDPDFTLEHYQRMFAVPQYMEVLIISFKIALISTVVSLVCGYPLAYVLTVVNPTWRAVVLALVLLPFWTNILVRVYSWMLILQTTGVLNTALVKWLGVLDEPLPLMYNLSGVIIGMVHYLLPPMVLILYSVMKSIDLRLVDAAQGLGAKPWRAFWHVFVPLSMPGVRAATMLIFILGLGFFITPALLGGRREITIAMLIETNFAELLNWGFGSALAVALLVITLAGLLVYHWWLGRQTVGLPQ